VCVHMRLTHLHANVVCRFVCACMCVNVSVHTCTPTYVVHGCSRVWMRVCLHVYTSTVLLHSLSRTLVSLSEPPFHKEARELLLLELTAEPASPLGSSKNSQTRFMTIGRPESQYTLQWSQQESYQAAQPYRGPWPAARAWMLDQAALSSSQQPSASR
jgi:hypothetical protein